MIFKRVGSARPYPDPRLSAAQWMKLPPQQLRITDLVTTKDVLHLDAVLSDDSTFFGDLFAHVIYWQGEYYLEDGLHRALRAALQQRTTIHARVYTIPTEGAS